MSTSDAPEQLLAFVSHELQSPVAAILGWTQLLMNNRIDPAEQAHVCRRQSLMRSLRAVFIILMLWNSTSLGAQTPPAPSAEPSLEEIMRKLDNPLSDLTFLFFQNDVTFIEGDLLQETKVLNSFKFQPVVPVKVGDAFTLLFRPVLQVQSVPFHEMAGDVVGVGSSNTIIAPTFPLPPLDGLAGRTNAFGDFIFIAAVGPQSTFKLKSDPTGVRAWTLGAGVTTIWPTASERVAGQGKYQAGPAAIVVFFGHKWTLGALAQQWWSYAGDADRADTNQTDVQYFINYKLPKLWTIGMSPNIHVNWKGLDDNKVTFPVGVGVNKMVRWGILPVKLGAEMQYSIVKPELAGSRWNLRLTMTPVMPRIGAKRPG